MLSWKNKPHPTTTTTSFQQLWAGRREMRRTLPCWLMGYRLYVVDFALCLWGFPFYQQRSSWTLVKRRNRYFCHMPVVKTGFTMSYFLPALNKKLQSQRENNIIWKSLCFLGQQRLSRVRLAGKCLDRITCNSKISGQMFVDCGDHEVLEDEKGCGFIITSVTYGLAIYH